MSLMIALGLMLTIGLGLTLYWGSVAYLTWDPTASPDSDDEAPARLPSLTESARRYLRGVAVALVGGIWAGALVTGPAIRLIMRLLAATAGDAAQGRRTEADEIVGSIDLDGTFGLYIFGGLLSGLASGFIYLLIRRWLPAGRAGGVVFGLFHLILLATRIDPLRPDNVDFALVGPGWLAVLTFGLATIAHGMAVAAIANRFSRAFPATVAAGNPTPSRVSTILALVPPVLLLIPGFFVLILLVPGLVFAVGVLRVTKALESWRSPRVLRVGRVAGVAIAAVYLPWTVIDLASIAT
ncbi:MAG TPA: hypothetical protein VMY88_10025 [Acidimicrobiales bacterium]|nr:hypothetical protein [Acidimicrobiales bacterium]